MTHVRMRRRVATIAAAAAIVGAGLTPVVASPVAGIADAATCESSSTKTIPFDFIVKVDYIFHKSAPATVGAGQPLTYSISVSTTGAGNPYVQGIWDTPPPELNGVKPTVKVKRYTLVGGLLGGGGAFGNLINEQPVAPGDVVKDGNSWRIRHTGWAVFSGNATTAEFTYQLPSNIAPGKKITSGGATVQATPNPPLGKVSMPNLTACTTVRAPNAGEAVLGSLDANGLGSAEGQLSSTGSLSDILPDLIKGFMDGDKEKDEKK